MQQDQSKQSRSLESYSEHEQHVIQMPVIQLEQQDSAYSMSQSAEDKLITMTVASVQTNTDGFNRPTLTQAELEQSALEQQTREETQRRQQEIQQLHQLS